MSSVEIVGTVALRALSSSVAEVKRFNVRADIQGRGHGGRLLSYAIDHARVGGFESVRLDTIRNPGPALHLFEKHGFVEIERYNTNPDADLFMELRL
jgi:N-acetylglutamate synthase-like GNAT family acetyltransferase